MGITPEARNKKLEEARDSGLYQNFGCLIDITNDLLENNRDNFGNYKHVPGELIEISTSEHSSEYGILPKIHFVLTAEFVYLNGGIFPFVGTDYPQSKKLNMSIIRHFLDILMTLCRSNIHMHDVKNRGLHKKYAPDNEVVKELTEKNKEAFIEYMLGAVEDLEDSQHYDHQVPLPLPVIDVETFEDTMLEPYPEIIKGVVAEGGTRRRQFAQYLKLTDAYKLQKEWHHQRKEARERSRPNSRNPKLHQSK